MCTMIGCTSYVNTGHSGYENESREKFLKVIDTSNLITLKVFLINTTKLIKRSENQQTRDFQVCMVRGVKHFAKTFL